MGGNNRVRGMKMEYIRGLESYVGLDDVAITLGKFDGLHRGHLKLIEKVKQLKEEKGVRSVVFAFDMIPLFKKLGLPRDGIMTNSERQHFLEDKVDVLIECPFTDSISNVEAEDFIEKILVKQIHAKYIVVGTDFQFGHEKRGNIHMLKEYAKRYGYEVFIVEKETDGNRDISSTYIREELRKGNMSKVRELLDYPYTIRGNVEYGKQLGRKLGFPTMNVHPAEEKLLPPRGVYMVSVKVDQTWYYGIGNIGVKPTVTEEKRVLIESHLFDFHGDAYGKEVVIHIHEYKRPEQKFASIEEMKAQVDSDIAYAKEFFEDKKRRNIDLDF